VLGLPEYDYPAPWAFEQCPGSQLAADSAYLLSQLKVKNTFLGTDVLRPQSLEEYFAERQTQSCPASGISLPPGLEDLVQPEVAAARLVAAEATWRKLDMAESEYLPSGLFDSELDAAAPEFLPAAASGLFDAPMDASAPEFLPSAAMLDATALQGMEDFHGPWNSGASPLMQETPELFQLDIMAALQYAPVQRGRAQQSSSFDAVMAALSASVDPAPAQQQSRGFDAAAPAFEPARQQPSRFDAAAPAFEPVFCRPAAMHFCDAVFATPAPAPAPADAEQMLEVASPECPTVGSQGHWAGTCRPCAFLYTKGCGNGAMCSFCHLCEPGEKKRRARHCRTSTRQDKQGGLDAVVSLDAIAR